MRVEMSDERRRIAKKKTTQGIESCSSAHVEINIGLTERWLNRNNEHWAEDFFFQTE